MENRNGKWVNVDFAAPVLDEDEAYTPAPAPQQHVDTLAPNGGYADDDDALFYAGNEHGYGYGGYGGAYQDDGEDDDDDLHHHNLPQQPSRGGSGSVVVGVAHESYGAQLLGTRAQQASSATALEPSVPSEAADDSIQISVGEPTKQGEGMNAYISYTIRTTTTRAQFAQSSFAAVRRYSDFVWLHGALLARFPGVAVPPLPEKLLVGRFSPAFVEARRRALQRFLQRCCAHPELRHSAHLAAFLEAPDDAALAAFRSDPRHAAPARGGARPALFRWLDDTVATLSTTLGAHAGALLAPGPQTLGADPDADALAAYVDALEPAAQGLLRHARGLAARAREAADGLGALGAALARLARAEQNASLQRALRAVAAGAERLAARAAAHAEREAAALEEPMADHARLVGALRAALLARADARAAFAAAAAELDARRAAAAKLQQPPPKAGDDERRRAAESDVARAQQRADDAKLEFDIVTERVTREVERFRREKLADFKRIILDYIVMQIEYSKKVEEEWKSVIPELAAIQVDAASPSASTTAAAAAALIQENYIGADGGLAGQLDLLALSDEDVRASPDVSI